MMHITSTQPPTSVKSQKVLESDALGYLRGLAQRPRFSKTQIIILLGIIF